MAVTVPAVPIWADLPQGWGTAVSLNVLLDEIKDLLLAGCKCLHDVATCHMKYITNDR